MLRRSFLSAIMLVCSRAALGSDSEYWRAKVAAAVAMQPVNSTSPPTEKPKATTRPIVRMYTASWCQPCQRAKAELKGAKLPFDLQFVDVSNGGQPDWCDSLPSFAWEHNGRTWFVLGFPGIASLIGRWEASHKQPAQAQPRQTTHWHYDYQPIRSWPGKLAKHLQKVHGVDVAGMSQDQMERTHDVLHGEA